MKTFEFSKEEIQDLMLALYMASDLCQAGSELARADLRDGKPESLCVAAENCQKQHEKIVKLLAKIAGEEK